MGKGVGEGISHKITSAEFEKCSDFSFTFPVQRSLENNALQFGLNITYESKGAWHKM